ncbi:hypothetical protein ACEQ8H_008076 [Pleosporales sp. CAS-2024a]
MISTAALPTSPAPKARADAGIVAHAFNGKLVVSGGTATVDFDSLSDEEKEEIIAVCPAFVDGVDGEMDAACF